MRYADVDIAVADEYLGRFDEAVRRMEGVGLKVQGRLPAIGIVMGSIHAAALTNLEQLPEVSDVEHARSMPSRRRSTTSRREHHGRYFAEPASSSRAATITSSAVGRACRRTAPLGTGTGFVPTRLMGASRSSSARSAQIAATSAPIP